MHLKAVVERPSKVAGLDSLTSYNWGRSWIMWVNWGAKGKNKWAHDHFNFMRSVLAWIYQTSFSSNYPDSKIDRAYKLWDLLNWSIIWTCCNGRHRSCVVGMGSRVLTQSPNLNCPNIWNEQLKIRSTFGVNRSDWLTDFECLVLNSIPVNISLVFEAICVLQRGENSKLSYWYFVN